jgi:hypothetical protein
MRSYHGMSQSGHHMIQVPGKDSVMLVRGEATTGSQSDPTDMERTVVWQAKRIDELEKVLLDYRLRRRT